MVTGNNVPSPGGAAAEGGVSQAQVCGKHERCRLVSKKVVPVY